MKKSAVRDQRLINLLEPNKETLTVTTNVATASKAIGAVLQVEATAGSTAGPKQVIYAGTVATGQVKVNRTLKTFTFYAGDAVTGAYIEYLESPSEVG